MSKGSRNRKARAETTKFGPFGDIPRVKSYPIPETETIGGRGSDVKQAGPVLGICILCSRTTELLLSHVIPKWAFKWHKVEGGVYHDPAPSRYSYRNQDGYKHYLMCAECEQYLGEAERALSQFSTVKIGNLSVLDLTVDRLSRDWFQLNGKGRTLIMIGLFGIVLKTHYSPTSNHNIIGSRAIRRVRSAILDDKYGFQSDPTSFKWFNGTVPGANPRAYAGVSIGSDPCGANRAIVSLGGMDWYFHLEEVEGGEIEYPWVVFAASFDGRRPMFGEQSTDGELPCDMWNINDSADCICGLGVAYSECCKDGWIQRP